MILQLGITLVVLYFIRRWLQRRKLPPGPPSFPLVGSIPFIHGSGSGGLTDSSLYKYGKIAKVDLGPIASVYVINDFALAKDLLSRETTADRKVNWFHKNVRGHNGQVLGIINTSGKVWTEQRRFALRNLRDFGFGKKSLDTVIQDEANQLLSSMLEESAANGEVLIASTFNAPVVNVLWEIVASTRFDANSNETKKVMESVTERFRRGVPYTLLLSTLKSVTGLNKQDREMLDIKQMIRDLIIEHEADHDPNSEARDFIDVYLTEIKREGSSPQFHREQLVTTCLDFFVAGSETSSTTLAWATMFMALNPEIQKKCQKEIDQTIGSSRPPNSNDANVLPYVQATVMEIQRLSCVAPASLIHRSTEDIPIPGEDYIIPGDSRIIANIKKFMLDPEAFPEPLAFKPERFLNEKGEVFKPEQFVPFGIGRRYCMGDSLAKNEVFVFFAMMLQRLNIGTAASRERPDPSKYTMGTTTIPTPFYVSLSAR